VIKNIFKNIIRFMRYLWSKEFLVKLVLLLLAVNLTLFLLRPLIRLHIKEFPADSIGLNRLKMFNSPSFK